MGAETETRIAERGRAWAQLDVEATWPLMQRAGYLTVQLRLPGYDSVYLAAAGGVWSRVGTVAESRFMVFDSAFAEAVPMLGVEMYGG